MQEPLYALISCDDRARENRENDCEPGPVLDAPIAEGSSLGVLIFCWPAGAKRTAQQVELDQTQRALLDDLKAATANAVAIMQAPFATFARRGREASAPGSSPDAAAAMFGFAG